MAILVSEITGTVVLLPADDPETPGTVKAVGRGTFPDPEEAVLALLNAFGFHATLCRVLDRAGLTDAELDRVADLCGAVQLARFHAARAGAGGDAPALAHVAVYDDAEADAPDEPTDLDPAAYTGGPGAPD